MKRTASRFTAVLCIALLFLSGCGSRVEKRSCVFYDFFDTVTSITGYDTAERFEAACALVEDTLDRYHRLSDIYHEYSGMNNAMTVNLHAGEEPVAVSPELMELLQYGREICSLTDGQCNIAMGAVLSLWHECRETALNGGEARLPEEALLREAALHCSMDDLVLDYSAGTVFLRDAKMSLDLGALAKGYAAEVAAASLEKAGYTGYALNLGGNVRVVGAKDDGSAWVAGVQDPMTDSDSAVRIKVALQDAALVTSGSYQRYYEVDGVRYHHIISPETLFPKNDFLSVTILAENSGLADALSTAIFNLPLEDGLSFVQRVGVNACWLLPDGSVKYSEGFENSVIP